MDLPKPENSTEREVLDSMFMHPDDDYLSFEEIASRSKIPDQVLTIVLKNLEKRKLVVFKKGRGWKRERIHYPQTNELLAAGIYET